MKKAIGQTISFDPTPNTNFKCLPSIEIPIFKLAIIQSYVKRGIEDYRHANYKMMVLRLRSGTLTCQSHRYKIKPKLQIWKKKYKKSYIRFCYQCNTPHNFLSWATYVSNVKWLLCIGEKVQSGTDTVYTRTIWTNIRPST